MTVDIITQTDAEGALVRYRVFGGVAAIPPSGTNNGIGGDKQRRLLAALLISPGQAVSADMLAECLWGDEPPNGAKAALHVHVSKLRQALAAVGAVEAMQTTAAGYRLVVDPDDVDHVRFSRLTRDAAELLGSGESSAAGDTYARALALWIGRPFADLPEAPFTDGLVASLERERAIAQRGVAEAALTSGRADLAVQRLEPLTVADPYDEGLQGLLLLALARVGRASEALTRYDALRERLADELGTDPGPELQALHMQLLRQDPALLSGRTGAIEQPTVARPRPEDPASALLDLGDRTVPLARQVTTLGRQSDRTVVFDDAEASRKHAVITRRGEGFVLSDSGSTNGTFVNDELIAEQVLEDGDRIQIGRTSMIFRASG